MKIIKNNDDKWKRKFATANCKRAIVFNLVRNSRSKSIPLKKNRVLCCFTFITIANKWSYLKCNNSNHYDYTGKTHTHTQCSGSSALFEKCQLIDFCSNLFCWPIFCLINGFSICGCDAMQRHAVIITYMPLYSQLKNYYNISSN